MVSSARKLALAALAATPALTQITNNAPLVGEGLSQPIPSTAQAPGTFSNGGPLFVGLPDQTDDPAPDMYGPRSMDLPFGRLFNGKLNFFPTVNDPTTNTATWGSEYDNANQSACGIPANAFFISQVAIHPYLLKFAGLDRYCMQDVCISFWNEAGTSDMMLKVTDVCTPDSEDGVPCLDPMDIKIDRSKIRILDSLPEVPQGDTYGQNVWWFFVKCWADGIVQPAYQTPNNWFANPPLPNKLEWSQSSEYTQFSRNQETYPAKGWEQYPNGSYNTTRVVPVIDDWDPKNVTPWTPLAGGWSSSGKGLGYTPGGGSAPEPAPAPAPSAAPSAVPSAAPAPPAESATPPVESAPAPPAESSAAPPPPSKPVESESPAPAPKPSAAPSAAPEPAPAPAPAPEPKPSSCVAAPAPSGESASSNEPAAMYSQCGGQNWTGPTTCVKGATCKVVVDPWYSQCL